MDITTSSAVEVGSATITVKSPSLIAAWKEQNLLLEKLRLRRERQEAAEEKYFGISVARMERELHPSK